MSHPAGARCGTFRHYLGPILLRSALGETQVGQNEKPEYSQIQKHSLGAIEPGC